MLNEIKLTEQEQKVLDKLVISPVTIREIFVSCGINSPTKTISNLRSKGIKINDIHRINPQTRARFKEYILEANNAN